MSRKPLPDGVPGSKGESINSLMKQLDDPRSLASFLPPDIQDGFSQIPEELLNHDENDLMKLLKEQYRWEPSVLVEALRRNFWFEYDRVQMSRVEKFMVMTNIYQGVCSRMHWHKITREDFHILSYVICKPIEYEFTQQALQNFADRKFFEILSLPVRNAGKLDHKLLELQMKTALAVDLRNKGGYLNRSETKNLTIMNQQTNHTYAQVIDAKVGSKTAMQIEADVAEQLKVLEEDARMQLPPPMPRFDDVVDATYTDVKQSDD